MTDISATIRAARTAKGLTQTDLAKKLGVSQGQISAWEGGRASPPEKTLAKLEKALGKPLVAAKAAPAPTAAAKPEPRGRRGGRPGPKPEAAEDQIGAKLTLDQLERHLWRAADILRGSIDSGDYKHYIFGLLFYKRLCDVWEEEYGQRLKEFGDAEMAADPEEHRFDIPKGHSWSDVRKKSHDIGDALNLAFHAIEDANPRLRGVFQDVDFNNKERFPDTMLEKLLQHFERHRLRRSDVEPDMLGNAYEYLIAKFADDAGKKGGEFYTPKAVVSLIVECLRPEEGMRVYDPTCGSGGMLLETVHWMERHGKNKKSVSLFGQERNLNTWAICKMNLFLHDLDDAFVERGDTLLDPKHRVRDGGKELATFDLVLANQPFSLSPWGHDVWSKGDPFGRDKYGCPPASYGDLAFVQHMIASLNDKGRMGVVVPHGVLFRGGAEGTIRRGIVEADLVEGVIGLGPNLFYGTGIPAAILLLNKKKAPSHQGKIVLVNGADRFVPGKDQNTLSDEDIAVMSGAFHGFTSVDKLAAVVSIEDVRRNDFNLNLTRYIDLSEPDEAIDLAAEARALVGLMAKRDDAEKRLREILARLGYGA